jgi:CDP-glycerol glycerophosphotransferase (TagB/SpsB family)
MRPKFLIYIAQSYGIPIGKPLQKEILSKGYEVAWFSEIKKTKELLEETDLVLNTITEVKDFNATVVLVATNEVPDFFPGIKVQIFHGFSVSKRSDKKGHFRIRGFFDLYCTQGPSTTLPFLELQKKHRYFDVVETGWSKVDPLFPVEVIQDLEKPIILIASTFTTRLSLAKNDLVFNEIERLVKKNKWNFLAVLHPKMEQEVVDKFKSLESDNFIFYDTVDLIPVFKKATILFADTTSAITEFVLQEKLVVTFNNNKPQDFMINVSKVSEIETALELALTKPADKIKNLQEFIKNTHPYFDGKSSKRVVDACVEFVKTKRVRKKPLNLIRKYKIRKKLNYFNEK